MSSAGLLRQAGRIIADTFWPPACPVSGRPVGEAGTLHPESWRQLHFITAPHCRQCGLPFAFAVEGLQRCAGCIAVPPPYARARAAIAYDEASRPLVTALKYRDRTQLAGMLAGWMLRAGNEVLQEAELLIPVPLHQRRLWQRRYNQSALLTRELSVRSHVPCMFDVLTRRRHTRPQTGLTAKQRQRNVQGVFAVRPGREAAVAGKHIVLIDDVMTTGATLHACCKPLLKAGATQVSVLTVARTLG